MQTREQTADVGRKGPSSDRRYVLKGQALEAPALDMVIQKLAADTMLPRLIDGEVAALLVRLGFEATNIRYSVMHK